MKGWILIFSLLSTMAFTQELDQVTDKSPDHHITDTEYEIAGFVLNNGQFVPRFAVRNLRLGTPSTSTPIAIMMDIMAGYDPYSYLQTTLKLEHGYYETDRKQKMRMFAFDLEFYTNDFDRGYIDNVFTKGYRPVVNYKVDLPRVTYWENYSNGKLEYELFITPNGYNVFLRDHRGNKFEPNTNIPGFHLQGMGASVGFDVRSKLVNERLRLRTKSQLGVIPAGEIYGVFYHQTSQVAYTVLKKKKIDIDLSAEMNFRIIELDSGEVGFRPKQFEKSFFRFGTTIRLKKQRKEYFKEDKQ